MRAVRRRRGGGIPAAVGLPRRRRRFGRPAGAPQDPQPWGAIRTIPAFGPAGAQDGRIPGPGSHNRPGWGDTAHQPGRLELSASMMQTLATFARGGDPNNRSLGVAWPARPGQLVFDATRTAGAIRVE